METKVYGLNEVYLEIDRRKHNAIKDFQEEKGEMRFFWKGYVMALYDMGNYLFDRINGRTSND